jgi:hypothetical protein
MRLQKKLSGNDSFAGLDITQAVVDLRTEPPRDGSTGLPTSERPFPLQRRLRLRLIAALRPALLNDRGHPALAQLGLGQNFTQGCSAMPSSTGKEQLLAKKAPVVILEGTWWNHQEVPMLLPYFNALAVSHSEIDISHRTIRCVDDIEYYVSKIPKNAGALLYFACHGEHQKLFPVADKKGIDQVALVNALKAKEGAVSFVHFSCCEIVEPSKRRSHHKRILDATGARWVSGYTTEVDWLQSTFLDLALVAEVFVPDFQARDGRTAPLKRSGAQFVKNYEQLARSLGFSALSRVTKGELLFPERLHLRS